MRSAANYKWARLRRWVNDRKRNADKHVNLPTGRHCYHSARAEVFRAVLLVMDMENRRARKRGRKAFKAAAQTVYKVNR